MPKWLSYPNYIRDEIPAPREYFEIQYRGPDPMKVYRALDILFRKIWEVKGTQIFEPDFRWDTTADPRPFFIHTLVRKGVEKSTTYLVDVKLQGSQPTDPSKDGVLRIEIHGYIETKFDSFTDNPLGKAIYPLFFIPYMKGYYAQRRRKYLEWHRKRMERLVQEIRAMLNMPATPIP